MEVKSLKVLAVLAAIIGSANSGAALPTNDDIEAAKAVADLIQAGKLKVDARTGKVMLNTNILEVLRDVGFVNRLKADEIMVSGSGQSTTGGGGSC